MLLLLLLLPPLPLPPLGDQLAVAASTDSISPQSQAPPSGMRCRPDEYWSDSVCCKLCAAGEYVSEPCRSPHTQGTCVKCGKREFMSHPSGLDSCFPCATCSREEEVVKNCTATSDQMCQCQTGRFYRPPDSHEHCRWCSRCPKGSVVLQRCNSTTDTVCGPPAPVLRHEVLWPVILGVSFICFIIYCFCKKRNDKSLRDVFRRFSNGTSDRAASTPPTSSVSCSLLQIQDQNPDSEVPTSNSVLPEDRVEMLCEAPTFTRAPESPAGVNGSPTSGCRGGRRIQSNNYSPGLDGQGVKERTGGPQGFLGPGAQTAPS